MNTPVQMLETISADIIENTVLLETIYKNSSEDHETDCAIARSEERRVGKGVDLGGRRIIKKKKKRNKKNNKKKKKTITQIYTV